jgi:hypothetical protein
MIVRDGRPASAPRSRDASLQTLVAWHRAADGL